MCHIPRSLFDRNIDSHLRTESRSNLNLLGSAYRCLGPLVQLVSRHHTFHGLKLTIHISTYVNALVARPIGAAFSPDVEIAGFAEAGEGSVGDARVWILVVGSTAHV
jgi:hypothetical protein